MPDTSQRSFLWHDYETFGLEPWRDRPAQFAGIRTDEELQPIGEPVVLYCQLSNDILPDPASCLIHGITPQRARIDGVPEYEFAKRVHACLSVPGSCAVGYNNLRFDAEFTRYLLYRNFYDPYRHEWDRGNSRWDLIDVCRMACALRPEGMHWPVDENGVHVFSLGALAAANNIELTQAHDALADTQATLELARVVKAAQARLFAHALRLRRRDFAEKQLGDGPPVVHVSGRLSRQNGYTSLIAPLVKVPDRKHSRIVVDLLVDPAPLLELDVAHIRQLLFTRRAELPPDAPAIGLKQLQLNQCPMLAPAETLDGDAAARLHIDKALCESRWQQLQGHWEALREKALAVYADGPARSQEDVEGRLYGGFFDRDDSKIMQRVAATAPARLQGERFAWHDPRLAELLLRYRARHAPGTLDAAELETWGAYRERRLNGDDAAGYLTVERYLASIDALREDGRHDAPGDQRLLEQLEEYLDDVVSAA